MLDDLLIAYSATRVANTAANAFNGFVAGISGMTVTGGIAWASILAAFALAAELKADGLTDEEILGITGGVAFGFLGGGIIGAIIGLGIKAKDTSLDPSNDIKAQYKERTKKVYGWANKLKDDFTKATGTGNWDWF